jgi:hypothetical protein
MHAFVTLATVPLLAMQLLRRGGAACHLTSVLHLLEALHVSRGRHPDWAPRHAPPQVATRLAAQASWHQHSFDDCAGHYPGHAPLFGFCRRGTQRGHPSQEQSELSITPRYLYCSFTTGSVSVPHSRAPSGRGGACSGANSMTAVLCFTAVLAGRADVGLHAPFVAPGACDCDVIRKSSAKS